MRAIVAHAAKDLRVENLDIPELGANDIRVRIAAGGICGSDLHYYNHGGFGVVRLREPMVLGHEIAGVVESVGASARRVKAGDRVAVSPSRPCNKCKFCLEGRQNQCLDMRFYGSAMRFPHVQGAFREVLVCDEAQAHVVADGVSLGEAAMAEPLAVCLHGARRAGPLLGKNVLITGSGPIGALAVIAARRAGAAEIIVTDVADGALGFARKVGADKTINIAAEPQALAPYAADKGAFDVMFEASGNEAALRGGLDVVRPGGVIVQLGLGGEMKLPVNTIVAKEIELRGTFRFHEEFALAVALIGKGLVDVKPLISATLPFTAATEAFELAMDRSRSMKVQLSF
ncbi:L-idonate 5-dehydrogenase [Methylocapsa sp. S129]|uniref:L-idonate 5-dehydrogenase n=1 Tax=Methylocapsa sp. S129 TaxID=1641869 RepID=UPI00131B8D2E|nr:L-idonate 5-dehydrogenase [Methylocapsa sp. S129]